MKRRDFLKYAAATALISQIPRKLFAKETSLVALCEGKDYEAITRNVIAGLGGMKKFVKAGDTVVVKPNMGWDRKPEFAANTHPLVMKAIVEECLKAGAKKVKVFDNTCNDSRRCYENSGIENILKDIKNVDVKQIDKDRFKKTSIPRGVFIKEWELYEEALSANVYINVPIAKHHSLTKLTLGLKNHMGIMGGNRGFIHRGIDEALVDVNTAVKSHITIIDATRVLLAHGPSGGNLKDVKILNKVLASTDIVAADAFATTLFDHKPEDIGPTVAAFKRGLGEMDLSKIKVVKA